MKKLVSLVLVLCMVLSLAAVAFAEEAELGTVANPIPVTDISELASIDVPSGTTKWYSVPGDWSGMVLTFSAPMCVPAIYAMHPMFGYEMMAAQGFMSAEYTLTGWGDILVGFGSAYGYEIVGGSCTIAEPPVGSESKPAELESVDGPVTVNCIETAEGPAYFMTWTNYGEGGNLILNGVTGNFDVVELNYTGYWSDSTEPISVGVPAYETVNITVRGLDLEDIVLDLSFEPFKEGASQYSPFEIEDQDKAYSFEAVLNENGSEVFYKLYDVQGAILTINSPNAFFNGYGDGWITEVDDFDPDVMTVKVNTYGEDNSIIIGVFSSDESATSFTVNVSEPAGYDENPIELDSLDYIESEIAGGLEDHLFYIWSAAISGKVTLSVDYAEWFGDALYQAATEFEDIYDENGEWFGSEPIAWADVEVLLTVFINGNEVVAGQDAVVFDVEKNDTVIIKVQTLPTTEWDAYGYSAYVDVVGVVDPLGSMNNPIVVNSASELNSIDVPAGEQVYIAISSMLNGQVLTIVGDENTSVATRFGAVDGNNGVFAADLNGVPSNMFVVTNNGTADATYAANIGPVALVDLIKSSQATLEAMLRLDFTVDKSLLTGEDNYVVITHTYADGSTDVVTIPQNEWHVSGMVSYSKIAAKEMGDNVTIVVYNAQGQQLSIPESDSIKAYAFRGLKALADVDANSKNGILRTLLVDMLNYGAAAQVQFKYDTNNLVNADLTDTQKAWASVADVTPHNNQIKDAATFNTTLVLESAIEMDCIFYASKVGASSTWKDLYAIATYTDFNGNPKTVRIEGENFSMYANSNYVLVPVIGMAVADYQSIVTCVVYDADGNVLATAVDSMESYVYRALASGAAGETLENLCKLLMKFSASADSYFAK
ncbi:MAG: hypothetical protein E7448_00095 [Ruminococcaceae bacterium]|nr:hypothetical protein [Oscillospiraceae bacterium]